MGPPKRGGAKSEGKSKKRKKDEDEWTYEEDETNDVEETTDTAAVPGAAARDAEKTIRGYRRTSLAQKTIGPK